jgi:hypothetical protein
MYMNFWITVVLLLDRQHKDHTFSYPLALKVTISCVMPWKGFGNNYIIERTERSVLSGQLMSRPKLRPGTKKLVYHPLKYVVEFHQNFAS